MSGIIYLAKNLVNSKVYVGQTWKTLKNRRGHHHRSKDCMLFSRAIHKYGRGAFVWSVLDRADNQEELDQLEVKYILQYNSTNRDFGYNIKEGGLGGRHSEKTRLKISRSKGVKDIYAKKEGKTQRFFTQSEAAEKLNLSRKHISNILNNKRKTIEGWFFTYNEDDTHPTEFLASNGEETFYFQDQTKASKITKANRRTLCERLLKNSNVPINGWVFWHEVYKKEDDRK